MGTALNFCSNPCLIAKVLCSLLAFPKGRGLIIGGWVVFRRLGLLGRDLSPWRASEKWISPALKKGEARGCFAFFAWGRWRRLGFFYPVERTNKPPFLRGVWGDLPLLNTCFWAVLEQVEFSYQFFCQHWASAFDWDVRRALSRVALTPKSEPMNRR